MIEKETTEEVIIKRLSREASIRVRLSDTKRDPRLKEKIKSPYHFFNHMLETLAWRMYFNMEVDAKTPGYELGHVICEYMGWTMGEAFLQLLNNGLLGELRETDRV